MTDSLVHRGPEGEGFWISEKGVLGLGHRRLSIIDLSDAGAQPMHYAQRYTITYNGELYNYLEVKQTLSQQGYTFVSQCDTEVILAAYACYGKTCLQHFDGMFAFAIWDEHDHTLFCARDRFGEKPFYYTSNSTSFLFASEMKALWAAGEPKSVHRGMMLNYLTLGFVNDPLDGSKTFYNNIHALPAAHYLQVQFNSAACTDFTVHQQSYWDVDKESVTKLDELEAIEQFASLLSTSVQRRLRSDVALGTSLSGGLDSSSIAALIYETLPLGSSYQQSAFSAIFPGFAKDESRMIQTVADQFQLRSHIIQPTADALISDVEKLAYHQEEPLSSASVYAQYKVYELAKQHGVTVLLDGQGADETLAGYPKYYHWFWQELLAAGRGNLVIKERQQTPGNAVIHRWNYTNYIAARFPNITAQMLAKRAGRQQRTNTDINLASIDKQERVNIHKPVVQKLNDLLYFDTMQMGLPELLRYADRNSMAHSREVRLPFLSHELVQFVFSLPSTLKIKQGYTKWILRQTMRQKLPAALVDNREKIGFEPPQKQWLESTLLIDYMQESRRKLVAQQLLLPKALDKPILAKNAYEANNFDWRYLCAAAVFA